MLFQTRCGARENEFCVNVKFVAEFSLPLLCELRWAQDGDSSNFAAIKQFSRDKARLDCFSDAHVIGDQ